MKSPTLLPLFSLLVFAWNPPSYEGYHLTWSDSFGGPPGSLPSQSLWNIRDGDLGVNNELQTYRASPRNVQTSGGNTLQLVPWRNASARAGWTSGRIESKFTFVPQAGVKTIAEGTIRFGNNLISTQAGIWPAFWLLGDAIRRGTGWPACGELDIVETVNGQLIGYGTVHCHIFPGGICNEPTGRGGTIGIPNQDWQRWRIVWDRTSDNWTGETITWFLNDQQFHQVRGDQIGDLGVWQSLAQKPLFFILNVAVGGDWPGYPNADTLDGYGSMMEVGYVALYQSF